MKIRQMTTEDLKFAARLTEIEGWDTATEMELEALLEYDPQGCLIAEENGERTGMCIGIGYPSFGFIGYLIVIEGARGSGIGGRLLQTAIQDLQKRGLENIYLDGVPKAIPLYERNGFREVCRSLRFRGNIQGAIHGDVRLMRNEDLDAVLELDRIAFGDDRSFFIKQRLRLYPDFNLVQMAATDVIGFILGRPGRRGIAVGPWISKPGNLATLNLLESLATQAGENELRIGVLESNKEAIKAIKSMGLICRDNSPLRMVLGTIDFPGRPEQSIAVGSAAKG